MVINAATPTTALVIDILPEFTERNVAPELCTPAGVN
jgi:hypothetical protein